MSFPPYYAGAPVPPIPATQVAFGGTDQRLTSNAGLTFDGTTLLSPVVQASTDYTDGAMTVGSIGQSSTSKTIRATDSIGDAEIRRVINPTVVDGTTITAAVETALYSTAITIPASSVLATRVLKFEYFGVISTAVATPGTLTFKINLGSRVVATVVTPILVTSLTNSTFTLSGYLVCRTAGATGTFQAFAQFVVDSETTGLPIIFDRGIGRDVVVDTTTTMDFSTTATFSATGNSITSVNRMLEI